MASHETATPARQVSHKDICIPFVITVDGTEHRFEAVGFLEVDITDDADGTEDSFEFVGFAEDGTEYVELEKACGRAGERVVTSDADWVLIRDNRAQLPDELLQFAWLVTRRPIPLIPGDVSCLRRLGREWREHWYDLRSPCRRRALVLRRSA